MDLRRYDLNLLVTLEALLDEGSVTGAARRLNLSQSAVSAALDRLRAVFADPLLVRTGNRMEPTAFATKLQGPLKTALASVSLTLALPKRFDPATARLNLRLGVSDYLGVLLLPGLYRLLARDAPGISIAVVSQPVNETIARIVAGEADVATAVDPPEGRDLFNAPLMEETFDCIMRAGHPLASGRLTVKRLLEHPARGGDGARHERQHRRPGVRRARPAPAGPGERVALLDRPRPGGGERPGRLPAAAPVPRARAPLRAGHEEAPAADSGLHAVAGLAPAHRARPGARVAAREDHRPRPRRPGSSTGSIAPFSIIDWTEPRRAPYSGLAWRRVIAPRET